MQKQSPKINHLPRRGFLKLIVTALGISAAAPLLVSCNNNDDPSKYQVNILLQQSEIHYSPAMLKIPRGATVTWLNISYYSQSVTCDPQRVENGGVAALPDGVQPWDSGLLYPGQRFAKTFDMQGTYIYFSVPMLSSNTVGTIIVQ